MTKHGLTSTMRSLGTHREVVSFLDVYDAFGLAAASRASNFWTQCLPWYHDLYWISLAEYVQMRLDLPHGTLRSVRTLHLDWTCNSDHVHPDSEDALFDAFVAHMRMAQRLLPKLQRVEVWVNLTGYPVEDVDPSTYRVDALVAFLTRISYVHEIIVDLRDTSNMHCIELKAIVAACFRHASHSSLTLALRSTKPALTELWTKTHEVDEWIYVVARGLRKFKLSAKSLHSFRLRVEVPLSGCANILGANRWWLKLPCSVVSALDKQIVVYVSEGSTALKDATGVALTSGPFYVRKISSIAVELYDSEDHGRRAHRFTRRHIGRQKFVPMCPGVERLGSLSLHSLSSQAAGAAALAAAITGLPDVNVSLEGSGFQRPSLQELPNVEVEPLQPQPIAEADSASYASESTSLDGSGSD